MTRGQADGIAALLILILAALIVIAVSVMQVTACHHTRCSVRTYSAPTTTTMDREASR